MAEIGVGERIAEAEQSGSHLQVQHATGSAVGALLAELDLLTGSHRDQLAARFGQNLPHWRELGQGEGIHDVDLVGSGELHQAELR